MTKGARKEIIDYNLSRYDCYLIVQNPNPRKKSLALGQTDFAIQTKMFVWNIIIRKGLGNND